MTWKSVERSKEFLWIVSDSRLSAQTGTGGQITYTDSGAKLLPIPVAALIEAEQSPEALTVPAPAIGLAYAGSSLIALQAYAAVLPLWSQLMVLPGGRFPTLERFAEHFGRFVAVYAREVSAAHGELQPCQCALVGFDPALRQIEGWVIEPKLVENTVCAVHRPMDLAPGKIELLGSGTAMARCALPEVEAWGREPLHWIRKHLADNPPGDVGGGVQIGYVSNGGFVLRHDIQPSHDPAHKVDVRYRGLKFSDYRWVGDAFANLPGMA